ncbi:MAG: DUF4340 domain-containing protein [Bacillota bacterium]|nr:DUF4340 domain-containing protein [Bacillota bacterium]
MTRKSKMLLWIVILLVAFSGYILVNHFAKEDENDAKNIKVVNISKDDIEKIGWNNKVANIELRNENGTWKYSEDEKCPVDPSYPQKMIDKICNLTASRVLTEEEAKEDYGFKERGSNISASLKGGKVISFYIGDINSVINEYYIKINNDRKIYMVSSDFVNTFNYNINDLVIKETIPSYTQIEKMQISSGKENMTLIYKEQADDKGYKCFADGVGIDTQKAETLKSNLTALSFDTCVKYNAGEGELKSFGFSNPSYKLTVKGNGGSYTLLFGNKVDGKIYVKLDSSKMVYTVKDDITNYLKADHSSL